jgi:hypothetical protein
MQLERNKLGDADFIKYSLSKEVSGGCDRLPKSPSPHRRNYLTCSFCSRNALFALVGWGNLLRAEKHVKGG